MGVFAETGDHLMRQALVVIALATTLLGTNQISYAADLPVKAPAYTAPAPVALYNWNGFYVGGNVGYGWDKIDSTSTNVATGEQTSASSNRNGVFGGGQVGYNWQFNPNFLLGVEGDIDAANLTGSDDGCASTGCSHSDGKEDWFATLRGRFGYVQNNWLFFATGGAVWLHGSTTRTVVAVTNRNNAILVGQSSTASGTDVGWTVGGGIDWGFMPNWSMNLEYRFMDVQTSRVFTYSLPTATRNNDSTDKISTVRVSLDYHFH